MSKKRDEMAENHLPYLTTGNDSDFVRQFANSFIDQRRDAFIQGWNAAILHAPEVLALVEALKDIRWNFKMTEEDRMDKAEEALAKISEPSAEKEGEL